MNTDNTTQPQNSQADYAPLPVMEGYRFYRFTGSEEDYENIAQVVNSRQGERDFFAPTTADEIKREFSHHGTTCDAKRDLLFVEKDGQVIAYCRVSEGKSIDEEKWEYFTILNINPKYWDQKLAHIMLEWAEQQARERNRVHHPGEKAECGFNCLEQMPEKMALMKEAGYKPVRYWDTLIHHLEDIPHYPMPEGLELRVALPSHYRKIWDADQEAFQDHWGMHEVSEEDYQAWIDPKNDFQPYLFQVAWDGDEIAGEVLPWIVGSQNEVKKRARATIGDVAVRRPWRGKGLAKALICRTLNALKLLNIKEVELVVDSENPTGAYKLYKSLGFVYEERGVSWRKPLN